ncbi:class I SAM-dependent methyltransferase [Paenibacillus sp. CFBP13512]|uniref:class I SAM-dependent methyltransferase n=1 Tax=Paenibacillus sp. CFBP13512 TaxID=2184007 RepID=UPI001375649E|nr:class I SAM-dependent methyltransferase [Paenibacillus sp. CFBP13512]
MNKTTHNTIEYFKDKANKYDLVEEQVYWQLSDQLLWKAFKKEILDKLPANFTFFDAGGGTGRWSLKILQEYPNSKGYTYDLSKDMLEQALHKRESNMLESRWTIQQGDLHNIKDVQVESIDVCFNFHNVLGFVEEPLKVLKEVTKLLKPNGYLVSFTPNLYHALYFNISLGRIEEAQKLTNGKGRFTLEMPDIYMFTPQQLQEYYKDCGLNVTSLKGFPAFIYPGFLETQIEGNTQTLSEVLSDSQVFKQILDLESLYLDVEELVSRGNNIFIVGQK